MLKLVMKKARQKTEKAFSPKGRTAVARPAPIVGITEPGPDRFERRKRRETAQKSSGAVLFAYQMDMPLNVTITITWAALIQAGEQNEGHCLDKDERAREAYLRTELARLCRNEGIAFAAIWSRDVGARLGAHIHLAMFWPSRKLDKLIALLERVSGSPAEFIRAPYSHDVAARSMCGGWQINMNNRSNDKESALSWVEYLTSQHDKHPGPSKVRGKAFGVSEALGAAAQERARAALEVQSAKYAWVRKMGDGSP